MNGRWRGAGGVSACAQSSCSGDAFVYIDSVTVRELFVLTGKEVSQWAITTVPVRRRGIVASTQRENRLVHRGPNSTGSRLSFFSLRPAAYAFDMRIKG